MYSSVKIRAGAKEKLEELQAKLRLRGVKASLHEILEKLIEMGLENEEYLLSKLAPEELEEDPALKLLENPVDWGVEDSSLRIDEVLYGGGLHRHKHLRSSEKQERR